MIGQCGMIVLTWFWLAVVWLSGWTIASLPVRSQSRQSLSANERGKLAGHLATAFLAGVLACVLPLYVILAITGRLTPIALSAVLGGQLVMACLGARSLVRELRHHAGTMQNWRGLAGWALILGLLASGIPFWGYDAQAIYGLKAKILADGLSIYGPDFMDPYRVHYWNNYPLLVPLLEAQAFFWRNQWAVLTGQELWNDLGMPVILWGFIVALVLQVAATTERHWPGCGPWMGLVFAITPMLWRWTEGAGLSGSVDIVFASLVLSAVIQLSQLAEAAQLQWGPLVRGGLFLTAACLTKQEGAIATGAILGAFVATTVWKLWRGRESLGSLVGRRVILSGVRCLLLVGLLVLPTFVFLRAVHGPMPAPPYSRPYLAAFNFDWLSRIGDRPLTVGAFAVNEFFNNRWGLLWLLGVFGLFLPRSRPIDAATMFCRAYFLLVLAAYLGIFVVTPYPLQFHLHTAFARLMFHIFPVFVIVTIEQIASLPWRRPALPAEPVAG
ncbi:MAG: hypothetical protein KatS3mg112_0249 [Thermogutta sp.]|nr:MAG: hypothetical protein KatS3mg112_0249 [Thermogutta sp.]